MQFLNTLLLVVQILSAITMIGLVLVQHGKGADMGASFGSGASGSLFGATGSANFLSRSTAVCATLFFVATLGLSVMNTRAASSGRGETGSSVLDQPAAAASAASASGAVPVPAIPSPAVPAPTAVPAPSTVPAPASAASK